MTIEENQFQALRELLTIGNEYCHFIENQAKYEPFYRLAFLQKGLTALYLKGALLPFAEECDESFMQRVVTEENYEILFNELRESFGKNDVFLTTDAASADAVQNSLSENLTDVYQDMKDLLFNFSRGFENSRQCSAYYAAKWFWKRWGAAALKVLPIIHELLADLNHEQEVE